MAKEKMRWYQSATIKGKKMQGMRQGDSSQNRWKDLILPLLPFEGEGRVFTDLGCNAGFYSRQAKDLGFEATGVEKEKHFIDHANYWEEQEPKGIKIVHEDILKYDLPCSSIVVLANVHYWLTPKEFKLLISRFKKRALYVLVVGRNDGRSTLKSPHDSRTLRRNFRQFEEINSVRTRRHYSILFKNNLIEKDVTEALEKSQVINTKVFFPAFVDFLKGDDTEYYKYMDYFKWRGRDKTKAADYYLDRHRKIFESIKELGILESILIDGDQVINGNHRLVIAHHLGIKKILCRQLSI